MPQTREVEVTLKFRYRVKDDQLPMDWDDVLITDRSLFEEDITNLVQALDGLPYTVSLRFV